MFPLILKTLRTEKGLTQQKIADHLQISRSVLSNYETGIVDPTLSVLKKLSDYFGVSIDYLIGREDDFGNITIASPSASTLSEKENSLISLYRKLKPHTQAYVYGIVENLAVQG